MLSVMLMQPLHLSEKKGLFFHQVFILVNLTVLLGRFGFSVIFSTLLFLHGTILGTPYVDNKMWVDIWGVTRLHPTKKETSISRERSHIPGEKEMPKRDGICDHSQKGNQSPQASSKRNAKLATQTSPPNWLQITRWIGVGKVLQSNLVKLFGHVITWCRTAKL